MERLQNVDMREFTSFKAGERQRDGDFRKRGRAA